MTERWCCCRGIGGPQAWVELGPSKRVRGCGVVEGCWDWALSGWGSPVVWGFKLAVKRQSPLGRIRGLLAADGAQAPKLARASVALHPLLHGKSQSVTFWNTHTQKMLVLHFIFLWPPSFLLEVFYHRLFLCLAIFLFHYVVQKNISFMNLS